jgi:hypothetical protein
MGNRGIKETLAKAIDTVIFPGPPMNNGTFCTLLENKQLPKVIGN